MSYELEVKRRDRFIHVTMTGENSTEHMLGALSEIRDICNDQQCWRVLVENRLIGEQLDEKQIVEVINTEGPYVAGLFSAIAYVAEDRDFELAKFGESVAVDRGVPLMVFPTVAEAEDWIHWRPEDVPDDE